METSGKNDQKRITCRLWILSLVFIVLSPLPISAKSFVLEPDYFSIDIWGGIESNLHPDWRSRTVDHSWYGLIFTWGKYLANQHYRINVSPQIGLHHAQKDNINMEYSKYGLSMGTDVWFIRDFRVPHTASTIYLGIGLGLHTMIPSGGQAALGNSGLLGMFGGTIGFKFPITINYFFSLETRVNHISDILQSDSGRNHHGIVLGITRSF